MNFNGPWMLLAAGLLVAATWWFLSHHFSRDAKLARRRRRSNSRVEPRIKRPMVKLSVNPKPKKKKTRR